MAPFMTRVYRVFKPKKRNPKEIKIIYASGLPKTHPALLGHVVSQKGYINHKAMYIRRGEADIKELLYTSRRALYERAVELGGNAIIRESWTCMVKDLDGVLTVKIRYRGLAGVCDLMDPHEPVAIDEAEMVDEDLDGSAELAWPQRRYSDDDFMSGTSNSIRGALPPMINIPPPIVPPPPMDRRLTQSPLFTPSDSMVESQRSWPPPHMRTASD